MRQGPTGAPGGARAASRGPGLIPCIPDDWTVWAFSDPHGVASGLEAALREAGIVDAGLRWDAPARTALVGCGDYLDRGGASRRVVDLLRRLETEALAADGAVHLARGNHEDALLRLSTGASREFATWLAYGGKATLASWGIDGLDPDDPRATILRLGDLTPGLFEWLAGMPPAVRWRDVLFVHGGLPPASGPDDLGAETEEHLWIRHGFYGTAWSSGLFARYERAGIRRVVFGHSPQPNGIGLYHDGRSLALDTNACGSPSMPDGAMRMVTLVRLDGDVDFARARTVVVATDGAPDGRLAGR